MIEIVLKSNISQRIVKASYTGRQLMDKSEDEIVDEMGACDCEPVGETYVIGCNCCDEWDNYTLIIGNENNYNCMS